MLEPYDGKFSFKQAIRVIEADAYHFWMKKMSAYHNYVQAGLAAQGILQYLAATFPKLIFSSFGSWFRTIRPEMPPSELLTTIILLLLPIAAHCGTMVTYGKHILS